MNKRERKRNKPAFLCGETLGIEGAETTNSQHLISAYLLNRFRRGQCVHTYYARKLTRFLIKFNSISLTQIHTHTKTQGKEKKTLRATFFLIAVSESKEKLNLEDAQRTCAISDTKYDFLTETFSIKMKNCQWEKRNFTQKKIDWNSIEFASIKWRQNFRREFDFSQFLPQ